MSHSKKELAEYRFNRANETIEEAILLAEKKHWNATVNRLYYACFYAVSAYFVLHDLKSNTHKGAKVQFNKELIRTEKLREEHGELYNKLFGFRHDADYEDFVIFTEEEVAPLLPQSQAFVQAISELIKNANDA